MEDEPRIRPNEDLPRPEPLKPEFDGHEYTAFDKWEYEPFIHKTNQNHLWRDIAESYYRASVLLTEGVAERRLDEDIEGVTGVFLFRHYLELSLKRIIVSGRWLLIEDKNAARENVEEVARIHSLTALWASVLKDAKPKMRDWDNYDTEFVEKCIAEFDGVDEKGFAFRYPGQGGELCRFDFGTMRREMEHIYQTLKGIETYLVESHNENKEWDSFLGSEYGTDLGW